MSHVNRFILASSAALNRKRLTHYPLFLLGLSWLVYFGTILTGGLPFDKPIGVDLVAYVTGARIVLDGDISNLYVIGHQYEVQQRILGPGIEEYINVYLAPPFVAYMYAPFALLPYLTAAILWMTLTCILLAASVWLLWPLVPNLHSFGLARVLIIVFASAPGFDAVAGGQNSAISLLVMCLALRLILASKHAMAGAALGFGVFKPQLFVLFPLIFMIERKWKALTAWCAVAASLFSFSVWVAGIRGLRDFASLLTSDQYTEQIVSEIGWSMQTIGLVIRAFVPPAYSSGTLTTASNVIVFAVGALLLIVLHREVQRRYASKQAITLSFAIIVLITVAFSPHAFLYDNVLLVIPFLIMLNMFPSSASLRFSVAAAYVVSTVTPILTTLFVPMGWPLQILGAPWSVVPTIACLFIVYRCMSSERDQTVHAVGAQTVRAVTVN